MSDYGDLKNSLDTAKAEGIAEGDQIGLQKGEQIGMRKVAHNAKQKGMSVKDISELTSLSEEEISEL